MAHYAIIRHDRDAKGKYTTSIMAQAEFPRLKDFLDAVAGKK